MTNEKTQIIVLKGDPKKGSLSLDMTKIYEAEQRIIETKAITPATAPELRAEFNSACNITTKYIAWIKYEILIAKKNLSLAKAEVILDRLPEKIKELKENGIKDNADIREAFVSRDSEYQKFLDVLNTLEATKQLLDAKAKSFERAYWDCRDIAKDKDKLAASQNFSLAENELAYSDADFIGKTNIK